MKPKHPHDYSRWDTWTKRAPFVAIAPSKEVRPETVTGAGIAGQSVAAEKKGWRLWCFRTQDDLVYFLTRFSEAKVVSNG